MADPTRRAVIAAAAALPLVAVSGCNGVDVLASPPRQAADVGLLQAAIAAEQLLVTQYAAVLRGLTGSGAGASAALTAALEPLLGQHQAHLAELRSRLIVPAGSASPSPAARATRTPVVPAAPAAAVAFLRAAEQAAATAMLGRLPGASASLAQLFASISASEATHVPALDDALRDVQGRAGA
ncbi:MAG TPA: ferritin-like domain-containing protein [Streptosporangiaceae bacterium]|nr:ferritin-like domain-containing protein [Streptosporangiaceae bacterium]